MCAAVSRMSSGDAAASRMPLKPGQGEGDAGWRSLGTPRSELSLDFTLPTGQSFRWRKSAEQEYTGVVHDRLVRLQQEEDDVKWQVLARGPGSQPEDDLQVLRDYFNLHEPLGDMCKSWAEKDARFKLVSPYFPGARLLRQDPTECLFQFICSSNNHISRIHGMVERLCSKYGTPLQPLGSLPVPPDQVAPGLGFSAFPTLQQLATASEEDLRADGFGYRAKFVAGSVALLLDKEGGGNAWLKSLRELPYSEACQALITLPGVGPKVAACICLFSLDKHEAIPVDTHVWQLATKYYTPSLKGKTLTPKLMSAVEGAFIAKFGPYAGWAHNVLFISDLATSRQYLPPHLQPNRPASAGKEKAVKREREEGVKTEPTPKRRRAPQPATEPLEEETTHRVGSKASRTVKAEEGLRKSSRRGKPRAREDTADETELGPSRTGGRRRKDGRAQVKTEDDEGLAGAAEEDSVKERRAGKVAIIKQVVVKAEPQDLEQLRRIEATVVPSGPRVGIMEEQ